MHRIRRSTDVIHLYMAQQASRIVAESGNPCDRFHVGKFVLQGLKDDPHFVAQIDGGSRESENNQSLMERSVRCAIALRNLGVKLGDVIILMAPNHIHLAVPMYAAMYLGVTIAAIDRTQTTDELFDTFALCEPKVIFCQNDRTEDVFKVLKRLKKDTKVITFDKGSNAQDIEEFVHSFGFETPVEHFKPSTIDTENNVSFLIATSGTTGKPKCAQITHKNLIVAFPYMWSKFSNLPGATRMALTLSQPQWMTAIANYIFSAIIRFTRLQSSSEMTAEHAISLINTYKPTYMISSPTFLLALIQPDAKEKGDFTCFEIIVGAGSAVSKDLIHQYKKLFPNTDIYNGYGMSEASSYVLSPEDTPIGTAGAPMGIFDYRLIDVDTGEDIIEPHKSGELWIKGPGVFKGYLKNPKASEEVCTKDGWLKTGDLLYRDENWKFFYVERIKMLLKYKNHQISPAELEDVIRRHDAVADVAVTGVPSDDGDLPVACVVTRPQASVSADDIKELVKNNLADTKQLRGGVRFIEALPINSSGKVNRKKLKELALAMILNEIR